MSPPCISTGGLKKFPIIGHHLISQQLRNDWEFNQVFHESPEKQTSLGSFLVNSLGYLSISWETSQEISQEVCLRWGLPQSQAILFFRGMQISHTLGHTLGKQGCVEFAWVYGRHHLKVHISSGTGLNIDFKQTSQEVGECHRKLSRKLLRKIASWGFRTIQKSLKNVYVPVSVNT